MILLIDNYDSFSYNLYQFIGEINPDIKVIRNDGMTVEEIENLHPSHVIISPGPGRPSDAGVCEQVIRKLKNTTPILGVCLGHQAICEEEGAKITYARKLMHGKSSVIDIQEDKGIFKGLKGKMKVARYHSLAAERENFPETLEILAEADDGEIMAVKYKNGETYGVQFHPESILTDNGKEIIKNFLLI